MNKKIKKYAPKILFGLAVSAVMFNLIYSRYKKIKRMVKNIETENQEPYTDTDIPDNTAVGLSLDLCNPFDYIHNENDIYKFAAILKNNAAFNDETDNNSYEKIAEILYAAAIGYIYYEANENEKKIDSVIYLINNMEIREDDETFSNAVDMMLADLEKKEPDHFAVQKYNEYKSAAGKNGNDILDLCKSQLMRLDIKKLNYLVSFDILWDRTGGKIPYSESGGGDE